MKHVMKKYVFCVAIVILLSFVLNTAVIFAAESASSNDGIFSALDEVNAKGSYLVYRDNYYLDMEDTSILSSPGAVIFNMLANGIFGGSKNIGCLTAVATRFALGMDIYNLVSDFITPFFNSMRSIVFDSYATYFIAVAAFYFIIQLLRRQHSQVIGGLLAVTMIIAVGLFFYARPMFVLSTLNGITTELSSTVMDAPYDSLTDEDASQATAGDKSVVLIFNVMVHSQWQYLEFGSLKNAQVHEESILKMEVDSDERQDYIEEIDNKGLAKANTAAQIERFGLALIFFVFDLLLLVIILGFSVLILGYQFFVLFLGLLGTFIFVLALIPGYGIKLLKRWGLKLLTTSAAKILLVFFMAILFIIMNFLYTATATYGLLPVLFMMIAMLLVVTLKRKEIVELFLGTSGGKVIKEAGGLAGGAYSELSDKLSDLRRGQEHEMDDEDDDERRQREERYLSEAELRRYHNQQNEERWQANNNWSGKATDTSESHYAGTGRTNRQYAEQEMPSEESNIVTEPPNGRNLQGDFITSEDYRKAEELLERNYHLSRGKSEEIAKASGEPVKYSDFVQRTDAIRELGGSAQFDDRDILKTARILQRTEAAGGSMEDLIGDPDVRNSGEAGQEELRPQSIADYMSGQERQQVNPSMRDGVQNRVEDVNTRGLRDKGQEKIAGNSESLVVLSADMESQRPEKKQKGLTYFKTQFGDEKGEKYYEKMCSKYGEEAVSQFRSDEEKLSYSQVNQMLRSNSIEDKK